MKKRLVILMSVCAALTTSVLWADNSKDFIGNIYDYIENLNVFEYGQEETHAYFIPGHSVL